MNGLLQMAAASTVAMVVLAVSDATAAESADRRESTGPVDDAYSFTSTMLVRDGRPEVVWSVAFSPDGKLAATTSGWDQGDETGDLVVWDVATRAERLVVSGTKGIRTAAFSADGRLLAIGHCDGPARVFEVATGKMVCKLAGHRRGVNSLAFMPDGKTLITAGLDAMVRYGDNRRSERNCHARPQSSERFAVRAHRNSKPSGFSRV